MKTPQSKTPSPECVNKASNESSSFAGPAVDARPESLYSLIAQQVFFKGLNAHQLQLLADSAMIMEFEAGKSIFDSGRPANRFFLILEGKVLLESEVKERRMIPIQTLGSGDDLGWSWLFPPYYLHLSARALEPTKTIFFYGTRLRERCEQDHDLGYEIMKRIAEVVIKRLQVTQQLLAECTDAGKAQLNDSAI